jgi:hypothetical protein
VSELRFRLTGSTGAGADVDATRLGRSASPIARTVAVGATVVAAVVYSGEIHKAIEVQQRTGVTLLDAKSAVELARTTNAYGVFVLKEAEDKAKRLQGASAGDVAAAVRVTAIEFTTVGNVTVATISPRVAGVTIVYTVSGTDRYYDSQERRTDDAGRVTFGIPRPGRPNVRDTISVSAILSGRTVSTTYAW